MESKSRGSSKKDNKLASEDDGVIGWETHEFLESKRGLVWYAAFFLAAALVAALSYWATGEIVAPLSIALAAIAWIVFSFKRPGRQKYALTSFGLKVDSRLYEYSSFKTFSLIRERGMAGLYLITNQRFMPPLTIYLPTGKDKLIIQRLSRHIVYAPRNIQWWDRLTHYLGF